MGESGCCITNVKFFYQGSTLFLQWFLYFYLLYLWPPRCLYHIDAPAATPLLRAPASRPLYRAGRPARPVPRQPAQVTPLGFPDLAGCDFKTRRPGHYLRGRRRRRCVCITGWAENNRGQTARCAAFVRDFRLSSLCVCLLLTVSSVASPSRDLISPHTDVNMSLALFRLNSRAVRTSPQYRKSLLQWCCEEWRVTSDA